MIGDTNSFHNRVATSRLVPKVLEMKFTALQTPSTSTLHHNGLDSAPQSAMTQTNVHDLPQVVVRGYMQGSPGDQGWISGVLTCHDQTEF